MYLLQNAIGHLTGEAGGYYVSGERYAPDVGYISKARQPELAKSGYNPNPPDLAVEIELHVTAQSQRKLQIKLGNYLAAVTNRGGRTCHAAIIARELGIPAVVGCGNATSALSENQMVTVSCTEGDTGNIYRGVLETEVIDLVLEKMPKPPVKITMNVGNPELAFDFQRLPNDGVGLARLEFIIARMIGIHPKAVLDYPDIPPDLKKEVENQCAGYRDPVSFYVEKLTEGIATLGAAFFSQTGDRAHVGF